MEPAAPHVGGTGRLNGSESEIAQIDSDGGKLSIVTMLLFGRKSQSKFLGPHSPFWEKGGRSGSTIVPFDRVMVCSYRFIRLSIVTMSLSFMAEICNSRAQTPFGGNGRAYRVSAMVLFDKQGSCGKTETDIAII